MDWNIEIKCAVCGKGFTKKSWESHHDFHANDCPNFVNFEEPPENGQLSHECACDFVAHDKHCPQCHLRAARRIVENMVLAEIRKGTNDHSHERQTKGDCVP
jgi:hypothetical protein